MEHHGNWKQFKNFLTGLGKAEPTVESIQFFFNNLTKTEIKDYSLEIEIALTELYCKYDSFKKHAEFSRNVIHKGITNIYQLLDSNLYQDERFMTSVVGEAPNIIFYAADNVLDDDLFAYTYLTSHNHHGIKPEAIESFSERIRLDKDFAYTAIHCGLYNFKTIPPQLLEDKDIIIALIPSYKSGFWKPEELPEKYWNDKDVVLKALHCTALSYLFIEDEELKNDPDVVKAALTHNPDLIEKMDVCWHDDHSIMLLCAAQRRYLFKFVSERLKDDFDFCSELVKKSPVLFEHFSNTMRDNENVCLSAIEHDHKNMEYVSERLRDDKHFCLKAAKTKTKSVEYMSEKMRNDYDIAYHLITTENNYYPLLGKRIKEEIKKYNIRDATAYFRKMSLENQIREHNLHKGIVQENKNKFKI